MFISDPYFYLIAIPAVIIYGIGKGGLGGAVGDIVVPLMALAISPAQAAAILLPILCVMDYFAVKQHYKHADWNELKHMLPWAIVGIIMATALMKYIPEAGLQILIGGISLGFVALYLFRAIKAKKPSQPRSPSVWCCLGGFASTAIHAGGGPVNIYLLPKKLDKVTLIATMVVLFAIINFIKLIPYSWLGGFELTNIYTAIILMPLAPLGVKIGVWLLHRVSRTLVYRACYLFLFISGLKLFTDGIENIQPALIVLSQ